ncbi:MAG: M28 family peptidase [Candidatus Abyssobacteria bacterium SURF_5]|uniref:M28 family peptidase n=1 Tax=Abyssobacteria bacterium (strain SURF_5) TaxID=2093360 RepID=A0A3A4NLH0_ABYX5|nr:MAG: M28 family peptidase [Candidatus Abyssubacteria bacterium SURF_5]
MLSKHPFERVKFFSAEIGPRGPTTEAEARAAAYAASELEQCGAREVAIETFRSVPSLWRALEIACILVLVATLVYLPAHGRFWPWCVLICLIALAVIIGEFSFWKYSLSNLLCKRISQNVYAKVSPKRDARNQLVVIGHLDTNRTPKLFHPRIVRHLPGILVFVFVCVVLKILVFIFGSVGGAFAAGASAAFLLDLPVLILLVVMIHGDFFSPFTEGANDNATGAALALSLGEFFARDPLELTEVWIVCTGCEEATLTGIRAFLNRHGERLRNAYFVDLECLGIGELRYVTCEGMLKKYYSDPGILRAAAAAAEVVGGGIEAIRLTRGYTETAIVAGRGYKGITVMAFPHGSDEVPHWHQITDRIENIGPQNLSKAMDFLVALARELDAGHEPPDSEERKYLSTKAAESL